MPTAEKQFSGLNTAIFQRVQQAWNEIMEFLDRTTLKLGLALTLKL